jgi:hypothetical protein
VGNACQQEDPQQWPQWTDTVRPVGGRAGHDPDWAARISTGQHASARTPAGTARRHGSTFGAPDSHNMEDRCTFWETTKAVTTISAGHGLDLLRARRDSNP